MYLKKYQKYYHHKESSNVIPSIYRCTTTNEVLMRARTHLPVSRLSILKSFISTIPPVRSLLSEKKLGAGTSPIISYFSWPFRSLSIAGVCCTKVLRLRSWSICLKYGKPWNSGGPWSLAMLIITYKKEKSALSTQYHSINKCLDKNAIW